MMDVNSYLLKYKRKVPKILLIWLAILTFIIISIFVINKVVTFKRHYVVQGVVDNDYVKLYIVLEDLDKIVNNDVLYIDSKKYNFNIIKISENIAIGNVFYKEVVLDVNLGNKVLIDNNVFDMQFVVSEMTILEYTINLIRGNNYDRN